MGCLGKGTVGLNEAWREHASGAIIHGPSDACTYPPLPDSSLDGMLAHRMANPHSLSSMPQRASLDADARALKQGKLRRRLGIAIYRVSWVYLLAIVAFWIFLRLAGDRWWLGTLLLFGPLWVSSLPALCLIPLSLFFHRRALPVLLVAGGISLFAIMGFCVRWRTWFQGAPHGQQIRILTCNVNGKSLSDDSLVQLITESKPDVVVLQEWYQHGKQPLLSDGTWYLRQDEELLIASRYPIQFVENFKDPAWFVWGGSAVRYDIAAPGGVLHFFNIHLASPHRPFAAVMEGHPSATDILSKHLQVRPLQSSRVSSSGPHSRRNRDSGRGF